MVASVRHFGYSRSSGLAPVVSVLMTSPFSDSIIFSVLTRKQRFQKASFSNRSTLENVFEWLLFGVVVWTIAVLGSISAALSCQVYPEFGGGGRAPFPNSGW